ncbi:MAG: phytanoyl-CoA dioxygenase family protein, partial [Acidobacteriota bacterium]|nr:phytanoyl-CoA dioxygenase family protein [Acidobacteriota bacterium]
MSFINGAINDEGFAIIEKVIDEPTAAQLIAALERVEDDGESVRRRGGVYAIRNLVEAVPMVREFANSRAARSLIEPVLGARCFVVRSLLLDKTPEANWKVAWHQDLSIAVRERVEAEGFSAWSEKAGVIHVQPPVEILERMLTLRVYLDECNEENGPLRVIPGSHLAGRLNAEQIREWRETRTAVTCVVPCGGALLMKPLLLH